MQLTDLDPLSILAVIVLSACSISLLMMLLLAPHRDCFFFRWNPATRLLALIASPVLLLVWPILLFSWILDSRGVDLDELDFYDD